MLIDCFSFIVRLFVFPLTLLMRLPVKVGASFIILIAAIHRSYFLITDVLTASECSSPIEHSMSTRDTSSAWRLKRCEYFRVRAIWRTCLARFAPKYLFERSESLVAYYGSSSEWLPSRAFTRWRGSCESSRYGVNFDLSKLAER